MTRALAIGALFGLLAGHGAARAEEPAPTSAAGSVLAQSAMKGPFADLDSYCKTIDDEQLPSPRCHGRPLTGDARATIGVDQVVAVEVTSERSFTDSAIGLHDARGWWIDDHDDLFTDLDRARSYAAIVDASWERGSLGPRVRIRQVRSYWNKPLALDEDAYIEPGFGEYQCVGSLVVCGRDSAGRLSCSAPLAVAVTKDCGSWDWHGRLEGAWKQWRRWTFRLEPTPIDPVTWRLTPRGSTKQLLGSGALNGLIDDVHEILASRNKLVRLPF